MNIASLTEKKAVQLLASAGWQIEAAFEILYSSATG
jgi:hypothetical protein